MDLYGKLGLLAEANSENESDETSAAATRRKEGVAAMALFESAGDRDRLGLDRPMKRQRAEAASGGSADRKQGEGDGDGRDPSAPVLVGGGRRRPKNYMTKGRTDAWMRKYEEFKSKNLNGDFSWKDNVQLRAWVRQQRCAWRWW